MSVILSLIISIFLHTSESQAGGIYYDLGFGATRIHAPQKLFQKTNPAELSNISLGGNFGLYWNMTNDSDFFQFHFGVFESITSQFFNGGQYNLFTTYPTIRFEFLKFYFGFSYSPWVWSKQSSEGFSFGNANKTKDLYSIHMHSGLIWKATPNFHITMQAGADYMKLKTGGIVTGAQLGFQLRLYFFDIVTMKNKSGMKIDGWRYPFGIETSN